MYDDHDDLPETAWGLFTLTGLPSYYSLYRKLTEEDENRN